MEGLLFVAPEGDTALYTHLLLHESPTIRVKALQLVHAFCHRASLLDELVAVYAAHPTPVVASAVLLQLDYVNSVSDAVAEAICVASARGLSKATDVLATAEVAFQSAPASLDVGDFITLMQRFDVTSPDMRFNGELPCILADVALLESLVLCHPNVATFASEASVLLSNLQGAQSTQERIADCSRALAVLEPRLSPAKPASPYASALILVLDNFARAVNPTPTVPEFAIHLNRAATQEEYFRGNLKKTVISSADVKSHDGQPVVLMRDLRAKIATDLGMAGSVEMFELVVAGKICGPDLPLHKVYERIWKPHAAKKNASGNKPRPSSIFQSASGVGGGVMGGASSGVFLDDDDGVGDDDDDDDDDDGCDDGRIGPADDVVNNLQQQQQHHQHHQQHHHAHGLADAPMLVTYRLCAVDGEATEDFVSELADAAAAEQHKQDADLATAHMSEQGLRALVNVLAKTASNAWPVPLGRKLVDAALRALDECARVPVNQKTLLLCGLLPAVLGAITHNADLCLQILDKAIAAHNADEVSQSAKAGSADAHLSWVLDQLASPQRKDARLVSSLARLVPYLAIGPASASQLAGRILQALMPLARGVADADFAWMLHAVEALSADATALRDALAPLTVHVAEVLGAVEDAPKEAGKPAVLAALRLARGLVRNHAASQAALVQSPAALRNVVLLEEVPASTAEGVGHAADALLEVLQAGTDETRAAIEAEKRSRLEAKRARAQKNRESMMRQAMMKRKRPSSSPEDKPVASAKKWMDEMAALKEESGLVCVVCHEGYRSRPHQLLSTYVFCKGVKLPSGSKYVDCSALARVASASTWAVASASSFVCIHAMCHDTAARADRSHAKAPKDEWEGAALRNGHVRCNNLLPLRGAVPVPMYDAAVLSFFERVDRETKAQVSAGLLSFFSYCAHDLRVLLLRVSFGENLSEDTNGGGLESNLKLVVPWVQMGTYLLELDKAQRATAEQLVDALCSGADAADATFVSVLCVLLGRHEAWEAHRDTFATALMAQARAAEAAAAAGDLSSIGSGASQVDASEAGTRARARSRARSLSVSVGEGDQVPKPLRPFWVFFGLVDTLQRMRVVRLVAEDECKAAEDVAARLAAACRSLAAAVHSASALRSFLGDGLSVYGAVGAAAAAGKDVAV